MTQTLDQPRVAAPEDGRTPRLVARSANVPQGILRHSAWDALLVALALAHGALLLTGPPAWVVALGFWWNANTISHNFIHLPFFRSRRLNTAFSAWLSLVLGIPQTLWRQRHLAHHAGAAWRWRASRQLLAETLLVAGAWSAALALASEFVLGAYLPGFAAGLGLCWLQGHFEHARGATSHYGALYNRLFFNDGYHVEHHARPGLHWTQLPRWQMPAARRSRWPAVLRWLDWLDLETLERLALRSRGLQHFLLRTHERAFRKLLPRLPALNKVLIVGGGLFPRTALVLRRLAPQAHLVIVEARPENVACARTFLSADVQFVLGFFDEDWARQNLAEVDIVVVPLAFRGDRDAIYRRPPAHHVLVHDWLWRRRGAGTVVSVLLLKRLNLVQR